MRACPAVWLVAGQISKLAGSVRRASRGECRLWLCGGHRSLRRTHLLALALEAPPPPAAAPLQRRRHAAARSVDEVGRPREREGALPRPRPRSDEEQPPRLGQRLDTS